MLSSLAPTPPMSWNSWNTLGRDINETVVRETADALVSSGLKDCGYNYTVIDDCWSVKDKRDSHGDLIANPENSPNGIKALAWIWARSEKTIPSPGFKTVAQVQKNATAIKLGPLTTEQIKEIDSRLAR